MGVALQMWQQQVISGFAGAGTWLTQEPALGAQLRQAQRRVARQLGRLAAWGCHDDQFVIQPGVNVEAGGMTWALYQADIELESGDGLTNLGGVADADAFRQGGVCLLILFEPAGEQRRDHVVADGGAGAEPDGRPVQPLPLAEPLDGLGTVQRGQRLWQEGTAVLVEQQAPADPVEQGLTEQPLELGQRRAGGRLRQGEFRRSRGGAAETGDGSEDL